MTKFTPTQWSTVEDKEKFVKHFKRFVDKGMPWTLFYKWFYLRLSQMFGHIAHYNRTGFHDTWFGSERDKHRWLTYIAKGGAYGSVGDPAWTWSDVEKDLASWMVGVLLERQKDGAL